MYAEKMMHAMSEHAGGAAGLGVGVLPFDAMALYEQPRPRYALKMPRVVPDQKAKFESDELFRRLSRESEVKFDSSQHSMSFYRRSVWTNLFISFVFMLTFVTCLCKLNDR